MALSGVAEKYRTQINSGSDYLTGIRPLFTRSMEEYGKGRDARQLYSISEETHQEPGRMVKIAVKSQDQRDTPGQRYVDNLRSRAMPN